MSVNTYDRNGSTDDLVINTLIEQSNSLMKQSTVTSGVARPGPTRACALPSTSQALPSPTQLESRDSTTNQTKVIKYIFILLC